MPLSETERFTAPRYDAWRRNTCAARLFWDIATVRIHLYAICWNEIQVLGFFFRHYEKLVDRFVLFDDGSTDGTVEYARSMPNVEVRRFTRSHPDSFLLSQRALQSQCWKESRGVADWVIVTAIDEHIHHRNLKRYLASNKRRGVSYIPALGFDMVSDDFPEPSEHLARTRTFGFPSKEMSKLRVFDPDAIAEVDFAVGGHVAKIEGRRMLPDRDELLLLHYKHIGAAYVKDRHRALGARLKSIDVRNSWGSHYFFSESEYETVLDRLHAGAIDVSSRAYRPWRDHKAPRWWRPAPAHEQVPALSPMQRLFDILRHPLGG
jgi:glycosyltransferase involved in cell wall biosynthesis